VSKEFSWGKFVKRALGNRKVTGKINIMMLPVVKGD